MATGGAGVRGFPGGVFKKVTPHEVARPFVE